MRWLALISLAVIATGCGSEQSASPKRKPVHCVAAASGYSICGKGPTGGKGPSRIQRGGTVVAGPIEDVGRWTNVFVSPNGKTLLAQWSGACEIPIAYLVRVDGGKPRALSNYAKGSAMSIALGWQGARARVRFPQGEPPGRKAGDYLVDPVTMAKTLVRARPKAHGC